MDTGTKLLRSTRRSPRDLLVGVIQLVASIAAAPVLRRAYNRYGATDAEMGQASLGEPSSPSRSSATPGR